MSKKTKNRTSVILNCKRYVKAYLLQNFNSPDENWKELVNLSRDRELQSQFIERLKRGCSKYDSRTGGKRYTDCVHIEISWDMFYRRGWTLTPTEEMSFNAIVERRVKLMLRTYVSQFYMIGMPISVCIERFRERTHITECDWDTDSIRKDLQRNLKIDFRVTDELFDKMEKNVWGLLSKNGTISPQGLKYYENEED